MTSSIQQLLTDIGMLGAAHGLEKHASGIFDYLASANPERLAPALGHSVLKLLKGEVEQAIDTLMSFTQGEEADMANALIALVYWIDKSPQQSELWLNKLASDMGPASALATAIRQEIQGAVG